MVSMMNHCIGNEMDNVKGRQMPVHYTWKEGHFISISSPVGTQFNQAVGVAMASAYKGDDQVTITWLGDGTSAQGDYHYGLNFLKYIHIEQVHIQVVMIHLDIVQRMITYIGQEEIPLNV